MPKQPNRTPNLPSPGPAGSATDHHLGHEFMGRLQEQIRERPAVAWRGTKSGEEGFVGSREYFKTYFREWAITKSLPPAKWKSVFREFMED